MHFLVEPYRHRLQDSACLKHSHSHEDAEEEEDRGHIDSGNHLGETVLFGTFHAFAIVEDFGEYP